MAESRDGEVLDKCADRFTERLTEQADTLVQQVLSSMNDEVPELVGPSPRMCELATQMLVANLENVTAAVRCHATLGSPHVPSANIEYARLLAQRGVPARRMLTGYQLANRLLGRAFIDHLASTELDRDDLLATVGAGLTYMSSYWDAAIQTAMETHHATQGVWRSKPGIDFIARVDMVLNGAVTDDKAAEDMLRYPVSGHHVAVVVWIDDPSVQPIDMAAARVRWRSLPGVRDALVVQRDERTLLCWLNVADGARISEWMRIAGEQSRLTRVAFGELRAGIEGFRVSNAQARATGNVLALARRSVGPVARYRDVSAISFLAFQPIRSKRWVDGVLGDLAGAGEERDRLRHDLYVYFREGESLTAASRRLFLHRNTLKYRIDRAFQMLPEPAAEHRLDLALALSYCEWISVWDTHYSANDPPSREVAAYIPAEAAGGRVLLDGTRT